MPSRRRSHPRVFVFFRTLPLGSELSKDSLGGPAARTANKGWAGILHHSQSDNSPAVSSRRGLPARDLEPAASAASDAGDDSWCSAHALLSGIERNPTREDLIDAMSEFLPGKAAPRRIAAFLIVAIGNLSLINEAFGFHVGDEVLTIVGRRLRGCMRERDCFARFGSNKFGLLLADCEPEQLDFVVGRMIRAVRESIIETSAGAVSMTVRLGGVMLPSQAKTVQDAFSNALDALDNARARRGDGFVLFDDSQERLSRRKRNILIVDEVIRALNDRRMTLAIQPIVRSGGRETAFYECLLRMQKPDGTFVSAGEFIPVAEKLGLSRLIDHRVAELALAVLKSAPGLSLSINVSGETATDNDWLTALRGLTQGDRALTQRLMVEITETAAIADIEESVGFVRALKELGCRVAIDDFGAGYSSFRNLRLLDVDMVKIDGSFVRNLPNSKSDWFFVRTMIELARNFQLNTVAEWVGDEATAALAEKAGADFMQGFYFGAPRLIGGSTAAAAEPPNADRVAQPV